MSLSLDSSRASEFVRFVARFCGVNIASAASGPLRVRLGKNNEIYEPTTIAKHLARQADREAELCGASALEKAQIAMWLDFAAGIGKCPPAAAPTHWKVLENTLQTRTYLCANRVTLADAAVFWALYAAVGAFSAKQRAEFVHLVRWFDQVQHTVGVRGFRDLPVVDLGRKQYALTV